MWGMRLNLNIHIWWCVLTPSGRAVTFYPVLVLGWTAVGPVRMYWTVVLLCQRLSGHVHIPVFNDY